MGRLQLFKSQARLEAVLQQATTDALPYADFLEQVLAEEFASKTAKNITMRTSLARFPFVKSLDAFDFAYQRQWIAIRSPRFLHRRSQRDMCLKASHKLAQTSLERVGNIGKTT